MHDDRDVILIDSELDRRLREWGRWARQRAWMSACRSIEHRYVPPAVKVWNTELKPLPVDALDAWAVECAWRLGLPLVERMILRGVYVVVPSGHRGSEAWWGHVRALCRRWSVRRAEFGTVATRAAKMLDTRLRKAEFANILRASSTPARAEVRDATAALAVSALQERQTA